MGSRARVKFSHTGGREGRRERALERLLKVKEPNARQLNEISNLQGNTVTVTDLTKGK